MTDNQVEEPLLKEDKQPDAKKPQEDPPKDPDPKPITFRQMFRFADTTDFTYMWFGSIAAILAGGVMPLFSYIFGDVATVYYQEDPIGESLKIAIKFWVLAAAAWVLSNLLAYHRLCIAVQLDHVWGEAVLALPQDLLQVVVEAGGLLVRYHQS